MRKMLLVLSATLALVLACDVVPVSQDDETEPPPEAGCDMPEPIPGSPSSPVVSTSWDGEALRIDWVPSAGPKETHYTVYTDIGGDGCMYPLADNVTETAYTVHDQAKLVPDAPWDVRVTRSTSDSLTVGWTPPFFQESFEVRYGVSACNSTGCSYVTLAGIPHDIQYYELQRSSPEAGSEREMISDGWEYLDTGLEPDTVYSYEVRACNDSGCSSTTQGAGLTEVSGPVDIPSVPNIQGEKIVVSGAADNVRILWEKVGGATYYTVYQSGPRTTEKLDARVSAPAASYLDISPNESFFAFETTTYRVKACNKAGCSEFSQSATIQ